MNFKSGNLIIIILIFLLQKHSISTPNEKSIGSRSSALGNTSVTLQDFWSQFNNQAGLAQLKKFIIGFSYKNDYLLKSLSTKTIGTIIPVNVGSFGINMIYFGHSKYNEKNIGLAYGKKLNENICVGLQLDFFSIHQDIENGSTNQTTFEGGFIYKIDNKMKIGGHLYNPITKSKTNNYKYLPQIYRLGLDYLIDKNFTGYIEFLNHSFTGFSLYSGFEYIQKQFALRIGFISNPEQLTFGFGFIKAHFSFDLSSKLNPVLGHSTQLSMIYTF